MILGVSMPDRRRPDPFDVDLEALGAEPRVPPAQIDADPALVAERAELAELRDWWQANAPPLPAARRRRSPAVWGLAVGGALALAAAALLVFRPVDDPDTPLIVPRGSLDVEIAASRDGARLPPSAALQAGDEIALTVVPEVDTQITVATVEEGGEVSVLVAGAEAPAGAAYRPPGRIRLDAHAGREWLIVWVADAPAPAEAEAAARALLPEPSSGEDRVVREITRGPR